MLGILYVQPSIAKEGGTLKGAVVGGLAGAAVGHPKTGAAAGAVVGHHKRKKAEKRDDQARKLEQQDTSTG